MSLGTEQEVENVRESLETVAVEFHRAGIAPIKAEFLLPRSNQSERDEDDASVDGVITDRDQSSNSDREEKKLAKKNRKGMNKNRMKEMKQAETLIRAASARLCPSVIQPVKCKFGEKCCLEHDIPTFLTKKPADIGESCPLFEARGTCPFSYACRFGGAHTDAMGNQITKETEAPYQETINSSSIHIQIALRKRTFDFKRSQEVLSALKDGSLGAMEREKPKLSLGSLKGKKYLAPLTTVGNLPFRRLCVDYGADITCGEMALATSLLSGTPSEYSLVKRHPCEKIFGVQLAGGFPDTMAKAAQILVDEMEIDFIDINMGCPIDVVNQKGGGCALPNRPNKMVEVISAMRGVMLGVPLTVKIRTGLKEGVLTADETIKTMITSAKPDLITFHPRSKEQRYTKLAKWDFVNPCLAACGEVPLWVCGDVLSWEDYYQRLEQYPVSGIMIGRGALIKPWIFTEIDEFRTWDISANERLDLLKKFVNYGLDHWGSDDAGVERTRRFLLEWLSFQCRYIPVGLLERLPQRINDRPPLHRGRNELETLLSSPRAVDWIEISRMLLGPTPEGFTFIPKHKASSY
ncbi:hypothetical protein Y032_0295g1674 [Ancylostoma ceylanicum]|uniref:tRNA-dihydrouridine(47) synthase [NAD(P)(+)] n=1 Tax=Ancylostoma ceylanicum TaxID=53326 RepID=A0A016S5M0_9BILA|nr:hypothetical protein Y032_0295g1674 [Ancylostoma ceylanicum]